MVKILLRKNQLGRRKSTARCSCTTITVLVGVSTILLLCLQLSSLQQHIDDTDTKPQSSTNDGSNAIGMTERDSASSPNTIHEGKGFDTDGGQTPLDLDLAEQETIFQKTLFECTGKVNERDTSKPCLRHIPDNNQGKQRIAVLSTMNNVAKDVASYLQFFISNDYFDHQDDIEIIHSSHVPPYGYGKNHGWTKIIRVVNSPIMTEVGQAALDQEATLFDAFEENKMKEILSEALQQVIRWHCRLSHVAAHTALFTLTVPHDLYHPDRLIDLMGFVLSDSAEDPFSVNLDMAELILSLSNAEIQPFYAVVERSLSRVLGKDDIEDMRKILEKELKITNNLTKWPCLSFWNVGESEKKEGMSNTAISNAKSYAPDCSNPFVKCSVPRDRCEVKGDPICK